MARVKRDLYEKPWKPSSIGECDFYHTTDIPGVGVVEGMWDLRKGVDEYLGGFDFTGKRVLEIGPATGMLTFHIEQTAREIVAVDLPLDRGFWDFVPQHQVGLASKREDGKRVEVEESFHRHINRIRRGFWFCHDAFDSRAKVHYGSSEDLPDELGEFDVVLLAAVLLHMRSPVKVIEACARLVPRGSIIVTDLHYSQLGDGPLCSLVPTVENGTWDTWWRFTPEFFTQYLSVLGFPKHRVSFHKQMAFDNIFEMFTVTASREG